VVNVLPRIEMVCVNEWWWTTSCEWADVVFGVDSWCELKHPDMTASVTNPFLSIFPRTPLPRIFQTIGDIEVFAMMFAKMADLTGDERFNDYWKFVREGRTDVYLQRVLDFSSTTKGYHAQELEQKAVEGVPVLMKFRNTVFAGPGGGQHHERAGTSPSRITEDKR
jgi:nitrate reductase alpha subunit